MIEEITSSDALDVGDSVRVVLEGRVQTRGNGGFQLENPSGKGYPIVFSHAPVKSVHRIARGVKLPAVGDRYSDTEVPSSSLPVGTVFGFTNTTDEVIELWTRVEDGLKQIWSADLGLVTNDSKWNVDYFTFSEKVWKLISYPKGYNSQ